MAKVSVVIPFRDRIDGTREAIRSVLLQTFQDFEIVVVDDGSEKEYKKEIEEVDRRIIYLRQNNRGVSAARNTGIQQSAGEFIAFLDSDDLYLPEKLKIQLSLMEAHPEVLLSFTSCNQVSPQTMLRLKTGRKQRTFLTVCCPQRLVIFLRRSTGR